MELDICPACMHAREPSALAPDHAPRFRRTIAMDHSAANPPASAPSIALFCGSLLQILVAAKRLRANCCASDPVFCGKFRHRRVYLRKRPTRGRAIYGLAATGALICVEGLAHEWVKTHGFIDLVTRSPYRRDIAADQITRLGYPIAYPNALATVLLFFSACTLGAIVSTRRLPVRALLVMVLLLNFVCIVLTGSRGGLISMLFLPMAFVGRQVRSGRWIATASATLVVAAVAWMLRKPYARLRGSGSLLQRAHGWVVTLKITTRSPWFGEGPDAFSREWASYGPAHGYSNQFGLDGFYPNLMCQGGVVSLTVLSTLIIAAGREVKRLLYSRVPESAQNALYYLSVGLGVVLIHNIVETTLSSRPIILGASLLFGVVTGLRHREQETRVPIAPSVEWTGGTYSSGPRRQPA